MMMVTILWSASPQGSRSMRANRSRESEEREQVREVVLACNTTWAGTERTSVCRSANAGAGEHLRVHLRVHEHRDLGRGGRRKARPPGRHNGDLSVNDKDGRSLGVHRNLPGGRQDGLVRKRGGNEKTTVQAACDCFYAVQHLPVDDYLNQVLQIIHRDVKNLNHFLHIQKLVLCFNVSISC
jgi:hypothetical protein